MKRTCLQRNTTCSGFWGNSNKQVQNAQEISEVYSAKTLLKMQSFNLKGIQQACAYVWRKDLYLILGLVLSFTILGCSSDEDWMDNLDQDGFLSLNYQSMVRVSEDHLFLEVSEIDDKRCPIGVVCPKEAIANIVIKARLGNEQQTFTLQSAKLNREIKTSEQVFNYKIEVVDLLPYPYCSEPLQDKKGYIVRLKVEPVVQ